jgi:pyruvate, orthophosphate dikinase
MSLIWLGEQPEVERALVGGKALSINQMRTMKLPVPPAFVLTTDCCADVIANGGELTETVLASLREGIRRLEEEHDRKLGGGDGKRPLLISVRSGGARSMPGMMDTVLNLGINDEVEAVLAGITNDPAFAADTHRRYREQFVRVVGEEASGDPWSDLVSAAAAVFRSWNSPRALSYRKHHGIPEIGGTAVTVQAMVFGNLDEESGTGVLFTRNPMTGEQECFGEWLPRGQGEDVVSGRFDAQPLDTLQEKMPKVYEELMKAAGALERWGKDAQDIEFTIERGKLWLLQTRAAKRSPQAAVRIAVTLHEAGVIGKEEAVNLVSQAQLEAALAPHIDPLARATAKVIATGLPACPGVAVGQVVSDCDEAEDLTDNGVDVVLARPTTDPDDVAGMVVSSAIITEIGGSTSHAAVVSRELGTPCVVGCGQGSLTGLAGLVVTVDGATGEIFEGALPVISGATNEHQAAQTLAEWAGRTMQGA